MTLALLFVTDKDWGSDHTILDNWNEEQDILNIDDITFVTLANGKREVHIYPYRASDVDSSMMRELKESFEEYIDLNHTMPLAMMDMIRLQNHIHEKTEIVNQATKELKQLELEYEKLDIAYNLIAPTQWEPMGGDWEISWDTEEEKARGGFRRQTEEQAKDAERNMTIFNRLLAYRDEFDPDFVWANGENNCTIAMDIRNNEWVVVTCRHFRVTPTVYMSKAVAEELKVKLNNNLVSLDA